MQEEQKETVVTPDTKHPVVHGPRLTREGQIIRLDGEHALTIHLREGTTAHDWLLEQLGV